MDVIDDQVEEAPPESLSTADLQARIEVKREARYQEEGVESLDEPAEEVVSDEPPPEEEEAEPVEEEGVEEPGIEEEPEAEEEDDDFYVARYKSREAAEEGYAEKDRTIDRLYQELAQRDQQKPREEPEGPTELDVSAWHQWAEQAVAEGQGINGAMEALRLGQAQGYDIYLAHWLSDPDQVPEAQAFNNQVQRQFAAQQAMKAVEPVLQREQERSVDQEAEIAKEIAAEGREDFAELEAEMDRLVREEGLLPEMTKQRLAQMAQNGGVEGKIHAWEYLYMAASATKGKTRQKAQRVEESRRRAAADRAKVAATVSSSEGSATRTPLSAAESYALRRKNAIREKLGQPLIEE